MDTKHTMVPFGLLGLALALAACDAPMLKTSVRTQGAQVVADDAIEAGRYLVAVGGCNDCHTPGYVQGGGKTPESDRLKGSVTGWQGPWGTTYAHNLRLTTASLTEDEWVEMLSTRDALPIMPWPSVRALHEADKRAIYRYVRSLPGDAGAPAPSALPPGQMPTTPYEDLNLKMPGAPPPT